MHKQSEGRRSLVGFAIVFQRVLRAGRVGTRVRPEKDQLLALRPCARAHVRPWAMGSKKKLAHGRKPPRAPSPFGNSSRPCPARASGRIVRVSRDHRDHCHHRDRTHQGKLQTLKPFVRVTEISCLALLELVPCYRVPSRQSGDPLLCRSSRASPSSTGLHQTPVQGYPIINTPRPPGKVRFQRFSPGCPAHGLHPRNQTACPPLCP